MSRRVDENGFTVYRCTFCGGCAHPATGCVYTASAIACWACTLHMARWATAWTHKRGRKGRPSFYDHVRPIAPPASEPSSG